MLGSEHFIGVPAYHFAKCFGFISPRVECTGFHGSATLLYLTMIGYAAAVFVIYVAMYLALGYPHLSHIEPIGRDDAHVRKRASRRAWVARSRHGSGSIRIPRGCEARMR